MLNVQDIKLKEIANAIREKEGSSNNISASDFAQHILSMKIDDFGEDCTIEVSSNLPEGGIVTGGGVASKGMSINISAIPNDGYSFVEWQEDGETVTVNAEYNIHVKNNSTLMAIFNEVDRVSNILNDNSWEIIAEVSAKNQGANYWNVGDRKAVNVKGTIGTLEIDKTLYVYIIGFNHNSAIEGNGIHFGTFKSALSGGTDICLVDSKCGSSGGYTGLKYFAMNHWGSSKTPYNTNYGGWKGCDARYDILGSTKTAPSGYGSALTTSRVGYDAPKDTAINPVPNTLMAALPSDLRSVMKPITKYTDNKGNATSSASNVTSSIDYLPLLAKYEIWGTGTGQNPAENNYQEQYAYYSAGNSKIKYQHNNTATATTWTNRSPVINLTYGFCYIKADGTSGSGSSRNSNGMSPIFMV